MRQAMLFSMFLTVLFLPACGWRAEAMSAPIAALPTSPPPPTASPTATSSPTATPLPSPTPLPPTPLPPTPLPLSEPQRLVIEAIGLDAPTTSVGLDEQLVPIVPDHDVGWYSLSAMPRQGENVVFWGHVLPFQNAPDLPAPFARLAEITPGTSVVVQTADGASHTYVVSRQEWVTPDQVAFIMPQGREQLTLVSCIGDAVIQGGSVIDMSHRLITIAELVTE